jgi:hypothetical protein
MFINLWRKFSDIMDPFNICIVRQEVFCFVTTNTNIDLYNVILSNRYTMEGRTVIIYSSRLLEGKIK